jgi:DNA-directed RNA polymerase subunit RPC12/RpoP
MKLLDSIRGVLGGGERTYGYVCENCEAGFESPKADMSAVQCPECHGTRIRMAG